jgi:hypothetical protein
LPGSPSNSPRTRRQDIQLAAIKEAKLGLNAAIIFTVLGTFASFHTQPQTGTLYLNSEVEPWLDVDPTSADDSDGPDFIGVYQQDRYSDGGARAVSERASRSTVARASRYCRATSCRTLHSASATGSMSAPPILG